MILGLELDSSQVGYCWMGLTKTSIGALAPASYIELTVDIFPLQTGIINISGIKIHDQKTGEKFTNGAVQVFVLAS